MASKFSVREITDRLDTVIQRVKRMSEDMEVIAHPYCVYKIHDSGDKELYQQFASADERDSWLQKVKDSYPHLVFKKGNLEGELEE